MMYKRLILTGFLGLFFAITAFAQDSAYDVQVKWYNCRQNFSMRETIGKTVDCGSVIVPINRKNPSAGVTSLPFVILRAQTQNPKPDPIIYLMGGPGGAAAQFPAFIFRPNFWRFRLNRDFIIYDQRGTGISLPSLDCPNVLTSNYAYADRQLSQEAGDLLYLTNVMTCHNELVEQGIDLTQYNSAVNAEDLVDMQHALGYEQWNVFGISYGTKLALTLMRDHPEGIRSVILDSAYPPQVKLYTDIPAGQARAFSRVFENCAANAECNAAYPDLEQVFYGLIVDYNQNWVKLTGRHSLSGFKFSVIVDGYMLSDVLFTALYDGARKLPKLIYTIAEGDATVLFPYAQSLLDGPFTISEGNYWSVQCHDEIPYESVEDVSDSVKVLNPLLQPARLSSGLTAFAICEHWTSGIADEIENQPIFSDIPTLIVAGDYDPITPPAWSELVHQELSNSFYYIYPTAGHGAIGDEVCAAKMAQFFLDDPSNPPDSSCMDGLQVTFDIGK